MATDHKGRPLHAGKRTDDEMHAKIKNDSSWFDDSYRETGKTAGYPSTTDDESYKLTDPYMINEDGTKTYISQRLK